MLTSIISLAVVAVSFTGWEWYDAREKMVSGLDSYAVIIANNCKAALSFNDKVDAERILKTLDVDTSIVLGCIYDKDGKIFAEYRHKNLKEQIKPPGAGEDGYVFRDGYLILFRTIELEGERIGTICLQAGLGQMWQGLAIDLAVIAGILTAALLVTYLQSSKLQHIISEPVLSLAKVATAVSEKRDYSTRAVKQSDDEIGMFTDAFNRMLEQIQIRDVELVETKEQLETRVQRRTAELSVANEQLTKEVDERKKAEHELDILNKDLEVNIKKLSQSNQQLQEFTYIASHDLREPSRKISSFGQMLKESIEGKLNDDECENLDFMIDGANRMQQMIEALLTYSRVTTKGVAFETVDLNTVIEELKSLELAIKLEETGGQILVPNPLPSVEADPAQVRQLLQNLVANALKYHRKDTIPQVVIKAQNENNGMVRVQVKDNGIGIKQEQYKNLFIMFKRLHSRAEYEGTGIGLAVCKKIVERHQGQIGVSSIYGEGTTFWFTLPAVDSPAGRNEEADVLCGDSVKN